MDITGGNTPNLLFEALLRNFCSESSSVQENAVSSIPSIEERFAEIETKEFKAAFSELSSNGTGTTLCLRGEDRPSTSAEADSQQFKPLEIVIGDDSEIVQQPSSSSSLNSSHPETVQDAKIYARIRELREAGLWSATRLPKCEDPPRRKLHWDYLLEEVRWIASDFTNERKAKKEWARKLAVRAKAEWHRLLSSTNEAKKKEQEEKEAKRICGTVAKMIRDFWTNVDKVVEFRATEIVESRKRKALGQQLNFLVGAADKITSLLHEHMADSASLSRRSDSEKSRPGELSDGEGILTDGSDDERTIDTEEAHQQKEHVEMELNELSKEANLGLDELLTSLPCGYLESLGYKIPPPSQSVADECQLTISSHLESADGWTEAQRTGEEKPDLKNVDYAGLRSDNSEVRRKQLDNIAVAALEFQPKGNTLETTEVKTEVPFLLRGDLREYQLVGLDWLVTMYEKNLNGILADEMGLGKTIQTIALLAHLACARAVWGPHLIIVPTSVILNWEMELKKWCPSLKVLTYFGTAKERAEKRKGWSKNNAFHVCVTSYKLATQDIRAFKMKAWQYLILDEAQNIKNFKSQRWQTLLRIQSRRRLLLTGTPLQNSLMELWALLHFLMPHVFASHDDFKEWFHAPITEMVEGTSEVDQALVQRLHKILRPFILRRLKAEVEKQLPTKTEKVIPCPLSKRQRFLYNEFLSRRSTVDNLKSGNMLSVLGIIIQLRKCCNHPNLFEPRPVLSPLVTPSISCQFPRLISSERAQSNASNSTKLLMLNKISSEKYWNFFERLSDPTTNNAEFLSTSNFSPIGEPPIIDDLVRFVGDEDGGRFYRIEIKRQQKEEKEEIRDTNHLICNGGYQRFVNNSRKRKYPSDTLVKASPISLKIVREEQRAPDLFQTARRELKQMLKKRERENRRIGIWLSAEEKMRGRPILSKETLRSVSINAIPTNSSEPTTVMCSRNVDEQLAVGLFDRACQSVQRSVVEWVEMSLNRFLICVLKILTSGAFPRPFVAAPFERYDDEFFHHLLRIYANDESHFAQKAHIARQLEFPELRLIEYDCGKLQMLARLLESLFSNKHRCLIFTQMSRMLDILQAFLSYHNYKYFRLDGSTHIDQRQAMMERFNADDSVFCFILSTRSGGIGVNLTGADTVIFYDSDWNPTMDAQAQDRCHRIGQTRNVTIYRLISEKTIEENILTKSMQKRRLGEMAIDQGEFTPDFFKNAGNLRDLFSNETAIAEIIAPVVDEPKNIKDVEAAMTRVEDTQDAIAAQLAKEEDTAEVAEFDETLNGGASTSYDLRDIDSPSEHYLELISGLKPVERYAVNFMAEEYRPMLDREVEEAEAKIRAKQMEFMEKQRNADGLLDDTTDENGTITGGKRRRKEEELLDIAYDATTEPTTVDELDRFSHTPLPFGCDASAFDDIPIWMPPSPPNSEAGICSVPSFDIYSPIDGALLYQLEPMAEDELPPLLPSLDAFPRGVSRSPRKTAAESPLRTVVTTKQRRRRRRRSTSITKGALTKEERQQMQKGGVGIPPEIAPRSEETATVVERRQPIEAIAAFERPPSPPESAPNTPIVMTPINSGVTNVPTMPQLLPIPGHFVVVASSPTTLPPKLEHADAIAELTAAAASALGPSSSACPIHTVPMPLSTLDEAIESTLRKSRKRVHSPSTFVPAVPRYLIRNFGPYPQQLFERTGPDLSRHIFRLVLNALPMPAPIGMESIDSGGIPWSAAEDQRLLKGICEKHCLTTDQLLTRPGVHFNWEFVSQYVNFHSNQYRSPRQCALRYQNFIMRCDEAFEENSLTISRRGQSSVAPSFRRPRPSFAAPLPAPHSVVLDTNLAAQESCVVARKHATQMANCALLRRRMAPPSAERTTAENQTQNQLFCLTGRMPPQQEAQLNELGTRYANVARPTDIIDIRRQVLERRAQQRRAGTSGQTTAPKQ